MRPGLSSLLLKTSTYASPRRRWMVCLSWTGGRFANCRFSIFHHFGRVFNFWAKNKKLNYVLRLWIWDLEIYLMGKIGGKLWKKNSLQGNIREFEYFLKKSKIYFSELINPQINKMSWISTLSWNFIILLKWPRNSVGLVFVGTLSLSSGKYDQGTPSGQGTSSPC